MRYKRVLGRVGESIGGGPLIEAGAWMGAAETGHGDEVRAVGRGRYRRTILWGSDEVIQTQRNGDSKWRRCTCGLEKMEVPFGPYRGRR